MRFCGDYVTDLFEYAKSYTNAYALRLARTNINTKNTPYKAGLNGYLEGIAMVFGNNRYGQIVLFPIGAEDIYIINLENEVWGKWRKISSTELQYSDEPAADEPDSDLAATEAGKEDLL